MIDDLFRSGTPEADWLAGLLAADGWIKNKGRSWGLSQSGPSGLKTIEQVCRLIDYQLGIRSRGTIGQVSYEITATSPQMTKDLMDVYGIGERKTLTYRWPELDGDRARIFLQGYIEGDGCVGVYPTPTGGRFLHLSFVGTTEFAEEITPLLPDNARIRRISRCENLAEVRWNGRYAWDAARWLYEHDTSPRFGVKRERFYEYAATIAIDPPRWYRGKS